MNDDHEIRLTVLEHEMQRLTLLPEIIHAMDKKLDRVLERKECPAPGECVRLSSRIDSLELKAAEIQGGWKTVTLISSITGSLGGLIGWLLNHFSTNKHP